MTDQPPGPPPLPGAPRSDDQPPGPGYWKASDGNWYPPQQASPPPPPAPPGPGVPPPPGTDATYNYGQHTYGQQTHGQPHAYGAAPASNGFATAALVLGIISILMFWTVGIGVVVGILAVVFGILGRKKAKEIAGDGKAGLATAGIITGAIGTIGGVLFIILIVAVADDLDEINTDPSDGVCNPDRFLQDPDC